MQASKQVSKHTHAHAQCSHASVGLAQARPNNSHPLPSHHHTSHHHTLIQWQSQYLRPSWNHLSICYTPQMWMSRRPPPSPSATLPCMDHVRIWGDWVTDQLCSSNKTFQYINIHVCTYMYIYVYM